MQDANENPTVKEFAKIASIPSKKSQQQTTMSHSGSSLPAGPANALPTVMSSSPPQDEVHTTSHIAIPESKGNHEHESSKKKHHHRLQHHHEEQHEESQPGSSKHETPHRHRDHHTHESHHHHNTSSEEGREHLVASEEEPPSVVDAKPNPTGGFSQRPNEADKRSSEGRGHSAAFSPSSLVETKPSFARPVPDSGAPNKPSTTRRKKIDDYDATPSQYVTDDQWPDLNEAPSHVPAAASLPPDKSVHSSSGSESSTPRRRTDTGDRLPERRPKEPGATRGRKPHPEAYDMKPSADSGKAAFVPTPTADRDEDVNLAPNFDVLQVASLPPGGAMRRTAAPRSQQVRPGAVAITGADGPSGDEELGEDYSTVSSSALPIAATVVEDDGPSSRGVAELAPDALSRKSSKRRCCDKRMVLMGGVLVAGAIIVAVVLSVVLTGGEVSHSTRTDSNTDLDYKCFS